MFSALNMDLGNAMWCVFQAIPFWSLEFNLQAQCIHVPHRCQKFPFSKVKEEDMVKRLKILAAKEHLEVETEALKLMASTADGSLRDAETTMDQLSLLDKRISLTAVQELVSSFPWNCFAHKKDFSSSCNCRWVWMKELGGLCFPHCCIQDEPQSATHFNAQLPAACNFSVWHSREQLVFPSCKRQHCDRVQHSVMLWRIISTVEMRALPWSSVSSGSWCLGPSPRISWRVSVSLKLVLLVVSGGAHPRWEVAGVAGFGTFRWGRKHCEIYARTFEIRSRALVSGITIGLAHHQHPSRKLWCAPGNTPARLLQKEFL